jgi:type I restriction enzyme R subunit
MRLEDQAREKIDAQLAACGWEVQDYPHMDLSCPAVAVREFPLKQGHGIADYLLFVKRKAVGIVEAKREGETLTGVEVQTEKYSQGLPDFLPAVSKPLPFLYQSTGTETRYTNARDRDPASRDVFSFHRPETLEADLGLGEGTAAVAVKEERGAYGQSLLNRLRGLPPVTREGLRDCQFEAIANLETSLAADRRRALIQMQTGSGKTTFAVAEAYRLIKYGGATRVLFLVDRSNLARQTLKEFQQFTTPDDGRKFTELYNVQHLQSNKIDPVCKVVITTIQRLYSILQGEEEFDPEREEESALSGLAALQKQPLPVAYNPNIPIETFDFVFTDECHRSIYNLWRQVLEYFDAYLVGLTATPSKQTLGFFQQNLVMEYGHAQAVADGVNVDFDVYRIQTRITTQGATVDAGVIVDRRDRKTRKRRWEELDDNLTYRPNELDRAVVAEDQIRTVIRTFRDRLFTEIFPGRTEVPKTLIFAKDDSHADDIVRIVREEFGKGNNFCEKITYRTSTARIVDPDTGDVTYKSTGIRPEDLLSSFRNAYHPRIVVTVDMIATGTDVKPLEIVFFMRDVQSSNYFEQMKGRGCRTMTPTEFRNVTPDGINKTRYVIVDAVGVTEHCKSDSPPLEKQPTVPLKSILQAVGAGSTDAEVVSTLASRLARLDRIITDGQRREIERIAGQSMHGLIHSLTASVDPDVALARLGAPEGEATDEALAQCGEAMRAEAVTPFLKADLRNYLMNAQQDAEQTIDTVSKDEVEFAGASAEATEKARTTIDSFCRYIEENRDEITAIQLLYSRRRGQSPTLKQLKELAGSIALPPRAWTPETIWRAYEALEQSRVRGHGGKAVTDLVSLVRFALEQETILRPFGETVQDRFTAWLSAQKEAGRAFSAEEMRWLEMMRDQIANSVTIEPDDFDLAPFNQQGGLGRAFALFGDRLNPLLQELNEVLAA